MTTKLEVPSASDEFIERYLNSDDDRFLGYIPYADPPAKSRQQTTKSFADRVASWFGSSAATPTPNFETVTSPQPRVPAASDSQFNDNNGDLSFYASLLADKDGNPIGDAVKSVDDGLPIRDFIYASALGRLYYSTRDVICAPFGFYHGQRVGIRKGPLAGMRVVIVGVHGGQLHGIFEGETEAAPFLRCYHYRHLMEEYDLVALSAPRSVKIQPLTLPDEIPQRVRNFLMYAPDLTLEISLNQNVVTDEESDARSKGVGKKKGQTLATNKSAVSPSNVRRSISFADGPNLVVNSKSPHRKGNRKAGNKRTERENEGEEDDLYDINWLMSNNNDNQTEEGGAASTATTTSATDNSSMAEEEDGAALAEGAVQAVNPFVHREFPTRKPNMVTVYLTPTYAIEHSGSVGWSGEAMQPISGAGGVGRVPLYPKSKGGRKTSSAPTALQRQREYLESLTQPVLASVSATIIVPLVLSFNAVETLASTVETVDEVLDAAVEKSEVAKVKAEKLKKEAKEQFGLMDEDDEAAEFLRRNQEDDEDL